MGDREHDKGKKKMFEYVESGESSEDSARRMRARRDPSLSPLDHRDGGNRTLLPCPQQQPAARGAREEGDAVRLQMEHVLSQIPWIKANALVILEELLLTDDNGGEEEGQGSGDVSNPDRLMPPASSSQVNFAWDSTQIEVQPAATAGQTGAAKEASGSGQPQPPVDVEQQLDWKLFFRQLMTSSDAGWTHELQVPEEQRCPNCDYFPGRSVAHPSQHICLCDVCHELPIFCEVCISKWEAASQG